MILKIKSRPYFPVSGLTNSSLQAPLMHLTLALSIYCAVSLKNVQICVPPVENIEYQRSPGTRRKASPHLEISTGTTEAYLNSPECERHHKSPVQGEMCGSIGKDPIVRLENIPSGFLFLIVWKLFYNAVKCR